MIAPRNLCVKTQEWFFYFSYTESSVKMYSCLLLELKLFYISLLLTIFSSQYFILKFEFILCVYIIWGWQHLKGFENVGDSFVFATILLDIPCFNKGGFIILIFPYAYTSNYDSFLDKVCWHIINHANVFLRIWKSA